ncbi:MAG: hypothetical protein ABI614_10580, partial [Planctomycetota bacterium]
SAFAGNGLLDGGCGCATQKGGGCATQKGGGCATQKGGGCATQKGGDVVQKGYVHQKAEIVQKGGVAQKGCGSSKGGGCGSCSICLPRILPAVLHGIDSVLHAVFSCDSCGAPKGCGCGATQKGVAQKGHVYQKGHVMQKGSSCDCGSSGGGSSNPFVDDLQPPPIPSADSDARVRIRREVTRPVSQSTPQVPTRRVIKTASATTHEPRVLPAELVSPLDQIREARVTAQPTPAVIRTSATTSGLVVPKNPLR